LPVRRCRSNRHGHHRYLGSAFVVFELVVIFGPARPQMKPQERAASATGWTVATAILAVAFYYLVAEPTL
jgi:hypothetical protein